MAAKPIKYLELHYTMIQFLITSVPIYQPPEGVYNAGCPGTDHVKVSVEYLCFLRRIFLHLSQEL